MKYKKKIIWSVIIAAAIFGGYKIFAPKDPVTTYTTEDVVKGNLTQTVSVTGELKSDESVDLSFKSSGRVEQMLVEVGDVVTKGQRLAVIERAFFMLTFCDNNSTAETRFPILSPRFEPKARYTSIPVTSSCL